MDRKALEKSEKARSEDVVITQLPNLFTIPYTPRQNKDNKKKAIERI
jgi:hypothetical protein